MKKVRTQTNRVLSVLLAVVMVVLAVPVVPVVHATAPEFNYSSMGAADGTGSADDLSNGGTQGGIIKFGAYPQTKETDSATISALNSRASGWQSYRYYSGTGSVYPDGQMTAKDYMMYCDVKYGSNKYRGVTFSQYRPNSTGVSSSASNSYQDDNGYTTGSTYWFKYEPLQWKVLDPSEGLAICVSLIDSQPYHNYVLKSGTDPHGYAADWGDAGKNHYANDYANSSLRKWLNETFYATAFTESQQNRIAVNRNQNNDGYYTLTGTTNYTDYDSTATNDKIFLLSYDEVSNSSYGFANGFIDTTREASGTDYAKCQGLYVDNSYTGNSRWWLRSSGLHSYSACGVNDIGIAYSDGRVFETSLGVRPACVISNLSSGNSQPQPQTTVSFSQPQFQCKANETISLDGSIKSEQDVRNISLSWSAVGANVNSVLTLPARVIQSVYTTKEATFLVYAKFPTAGTYQISVTTSAGGSATCTVVVSKADEPDQPDEPDNKEHFREGYDFEKDRYPFKNRDAEIPKSVYTSLYGSFWGEYFYLFDITNKHGQKGQCYGMAATTACFIDKKIAVKNNIVEKPLAEHLSDVRYYSNTLKDLNISVDTFIQYGWIYSNSYDIVQQERVNKNNLSGLYTAVKEYINGGRPVVITLHGNTIGAHTVLAVGIKETSNSVIIIVNDSNNFGIKCEIVLQKNPTTGAFSGWSFLFDHDNNITYSSDQFGSYITYSFPSETLVDDVKYSIKDNRAKLLLVSGNDSIIDSTTNLELNEIETDRNGILANNNVQDNRYKGYWIKGDGQITFTNKSMEQSLYYVGYTDSLSVSLPKNSKGKIENGQGTIHIEECDSKDIRIEYSYLNSDGEVCALTSSGIASSNITAMQTTSGIQVAGLKDMTVTATVDGEEIAKTTTDSDGSAVVISVDEDSNTISVTSPDACAYCGKVHEGFFGKIIAFFHRIFARLFGARF